jgi:hypothetical protein
MIRDVDVLGQQQLTRKTIRRRKGRKSTILASRMQNKQTLG